MRNWFVSYWFVDVVVRVICGILVVMVVILNFCFFFGCQFVVVVCP